MRILLLSVLLLAGCGTSSESAFNPTFAQLPASSPASAPLLALRELHTGQLSERGQAEPYNLDLELSREAGAISGVGRVILDGTTVATGPLRGTDANGQHSFTVDLRPRFSVLRFEGTGTNGLTGTFVSQEAGARLTSGNYTTQVVSGAPPFTGRYTATLDDGTVIQMNATNVVPNDPNLPDVSTSNGVIVYVGQPGTMQLTDAGGGTYVGGTVCVRVNGFDSGLYPFVSCFLQGSVAKGGRYTYFTLTGTIKQGRFTLKSGF